MITVSQIVYNIRNILEGGRTSNKDQYSPVQILFMVEYYRSLFLRRDLNRFDKRSGFEQRIGLETTIANTATSEFPNTRVSTVTIPTVVQLSRYPALRISNKDDTREIIPLVDESSTKWNRFNKYTSFSTRAYYKEDKIYLVGPDAPIFINVVGIFNHPKQVVEDFQGLEWDDLRNPYPITEDMLQRITQTLLRGELPLIVETPEDTIPDTAD